MSIRTKAVLATAFAFVLLSGAQADDFTKGVVKKVDAKSGKVTIQHEELVSLEMPAMTMVFRTADQAMLEKLEAGQQIEFVAERVNGKLTITQLR